MTPNDYKISTDYATFKNDSSGNTVSLSIASGSTISGNSPKWTADANGGANQSFLRARMTCSLDNAWGSGTTLFTMVNISVLSGATVLFTGDQTMYVTLEKLNSSQVRLTAFLEGLPGYTYRINENVTFTFVYSTFINPFL